MKMNFCRRCGSSLNRVHDYVYKCENGHTIYTNTAPTAGIFFVTSDNKILLSERGIEPHKGMLDAFGGFVDGEETLEAAAIRELKEELDLEPSDYEPLQFLCSGTSRYSFGGEDKLLLSIFFWSRLRGNKTPTPLDDVAAIHSIPLTEVNYDLLHAEDVRTGVKALQKLFLHK